MILEQWIVKANVWDNEHLVLNYPPYNSENEAIAVYNSLNGITYRKRLIKQITVVEQVNILENKKAY